jgi:hypothetical protein
VLLPPPPPPPPPHHLLHSHRSTSLQATGFLVAVFIYLVEWRVLFTLAGLSLTGFIGTLIVVRPIAVRRASMRDDWGLLRSRKRLLKIARKAQVVRGERPTQPKAKHEVKAERLAKARAKGERLPSLSDLYHNGVAEYSGALRWTAAEVRLPSAAAAARPPSPLSHLRPLRSLPSST